SSTLQSVAKSLGTSCSVSGGGGGGGGPRFFAKDYHYDLTSTSPTPLDRGQFMAQLHQEIVQRLKENDCTITGGGSSKLGPKVTLVVDGSDGGQAAGDSKPDMMLTGFSFHYSWEDVRGSIEFFSHETRPGELLIIVVQYEHPE